MRAVSTVVLVSACSLGITPVQDGWDGTTEPTCDDSAGLVVLDAIAGGIALGVAAAATDKEDETVAIPALLGGLVFGVGAAIGGDRVRSCREAKATWRIGGAIGRASVADRGRPKESEVDRIAQEERMERARRERLEREVRAAHTPPPAPPSPAPPRGHFCATSATTPGAGLCAREKPDCLRARDAALSAVEDLTECTLVEVAWCFSAAEERCYPDAPSCAAAQARVTSRGERIDTTCKEAK